MAEKKLYDLVSNANKRIARINKDFIPVTVKSVADMYSNIIWEKGTRRQGQIKNFYECFAYWIILFIFAPKSNYTIRSLF